MLTGNSSMVFPEGKHQRNFARKEVSNFEPGLSIIPFLDQCWQFAIGWGVFAGTQPAFDFAKQDRPCRSCLSLPALRLSSKGRLDFPQESFGAVNVGGSLIGGYAYVGAIITCGSSLRRIEQPTV